MAGHRDLDAIHTYQCVTMCCSQVLWQSDWVLGPKFTSQYGSALCQIRKYLKPAQRSVTHPWFEPCRHALWVVGPQPWLESIGIAVLQSFPCLHRMRIWCIMYFGHGVQLCLLLSWLAVKMAVAGFWTWHSGSGWVTLQSLLTQASFQHFQETHVTSCYLIFPDCFT